jgi:AcrR family transcriptional regulator
VPRTVNPTLHTVRRDVFVDAGLYLIQTKGYEAMSVQDVLDALDTWRGAFYHYFDSKQALLEAVIDRIVDDAMATLAPIVNDPELPAPRKLEKIFVDLAAWKAERRELLLAVLEVWTSDSNALVRDTLRRESVHRLVPLLCPVIEQGLAEGTFSASSSAETARFLVYLLQGYQELAVAQFLARQAGTISFDAVRRSATALTEAFERILGVPRGSLTLMDEATLRFWFG